MRQADRQRILDKHHNAQRLLETIPVVSHSRHQLQREFRRCHPRALAELL